MNKAIKERDGSIILSPINWNPKQSDVEKHSSDKVGCVVAIKTTGFDYKNDEIIELSLLKFSCNSDGFISSIISEDNFLNEPENPFTEKLEEQTQIKKEQLQDQKINWDEVNKTLSDVDFFISFNASFERPFIEKFLSKKNQKWACAYSQIPWGKYGFNKKALELLCFEHNFYYEETSGIHKCRAIISLLKNFLPEEKYNYIKKILDSMEEKNILVIALKSNFEDKWFFNKYEFTFYNPLKMWFKYFDYSKIDEANTILEEMKYDVYEGIPFNGCLIEIDSKNKFKPLEEFSTIPGNEKIFTKEPPGKYTKPFLLIASNLDMSHREILKNRLYSWASTGLKNEWVIYVTAEEANEEKDWLKKNLYHSHFKGSLVQNKNYKPD